MTSSILDVPARHCPAPSSVRRLPQLFRPYGHSRILDRHQSSFQPRLPSHALSSPILVAYGFLFVPSWCILTLVITPFPPPFPFSMS